MTKLSKYEKETIINWNEAEDTASIYTFNADMKRRLAEFSRNCQRRLHGIFDFGDYSIQPGSGILTLFLRCFPFRR